MEFNLIRNVQIEYLSCNENQKNNTKFFIIGNKEKYLGDEIEGNII